MVGVLGLGRLALVGLGSPVGVLGAGVDGTGVLHGETDLLTTPGRDRRGREDEDGTVPGVRVYTGMVYHDRRGKGTEVERDGMVSSHDLTGVGSDVGPTVVSEDVVPLTTLDAHGVSRVTPGLLDHVVVLGVPVLRTDQAALVLAT